MTDIEELREEELEKITGGAPPAPKVEKVYSPVVGFLYQNKIYPSRYVLVTTFNGLSSGTVHYRIGTMQSDGKVHPDPNFPIPSEVSYSMFCNTHDVSTSLSGDYWVD